MKCGKGTLQTSTGEIYDGEFDNDVFSGAGSLTFKDGSRYEGAFKNGLYHGTGLLTIFL